MYYYDHFKSVISTCLGVYEFPTYTDEELYRYIYMTPVLNGGADYTIMSWYNIHTYGILSMLFVHPLTAEITAHQSMANVVILLLIFLCVVTSI